MELVPATTHHICLTIIITIINIINIITITFIIIVIIIVNTFTIITIIIIITTIIIIIIIMSGERIMLPYSVCSTVQSFLHRINQHYTSALSSIDTFQSISTSIDESTINMLYPPSKQQSGQHHHGDGTNSGSDATYGSSRRKKDILDDFNLDDDADDDANPNYDDSHAKDSYHAETIAQIEEAMKLPGSSLYVMAGSSVYHRNNIQHNTNNNNSITTSNKLLLSYMTGRLLMQLSISYIHYVYQSILRDVIVAHRSSSSAGSSSSSSSSSSGGNSSENAHDVIDDPVDGTIVQGEDDKIVGDSQLSNGVLEEPSLQVIFDLSVLGMIVYIVVD